LLPTPAGQVSVVVRPQKWRTLMFDCSRGKVLEPPPDDLNPNRAAEFFKRGDYKEALRRADAILAFGPQVAMSWRFKGECLFQMERYDEAAACFRQAHELGGPGVEEVIIWAAFCEHNTGRYQAAEETLLRYLAALPAGASEPRAKAERVLQAFRQQR
jgi:tetratricopeptide (TPR) repeat protein